MSRLLALAVEPDGLTDPPGIGDLSTSEYRYAPIAQTSFVCQFLHYRSSESCAKSASNLVQQFRDVICLTPVGALFQGTQNIFPPPVAQLTCSSGEQSASHCYIRGVRI